MKKAVIILPTYNEAGSIKRLIEEIFRETDMIKNWDFHVLVVDSGSPDKTAAIVTSLQKKLPKLHLISAKKEGLGKAYTLGFRYAIHNLKPEVLFEMDADLSHDPKAISRFIKKIETGADFVIGSRYQRGGSIPRNWDFHRKILSVVGNLVIRFGFMKLSITDWTSGFRAIKTWVIKSNIPYIEQFSGYVFQVAFLDNALKKKVKVAEVPIHFADRTYGISKIDAPQYIYQTLWYVFTHSSFIKYAIVGVIGAVIDFGLSYILIEIVKLSASKYWVATLVSAEASVLVNFLLNNFWSFSHKKIEGKGKVFLWKFTKFNLISSGALLIQAGGIQLLTNLFGPSLWYVYKFVILALIVVPYSYILYNKVIWKSK